MLELKALSISLGSFRLRADFDVKAGNRLALIGASGAGKSTLLSAIAGFQDVTSGDILWKGQSMRNARPSERPVNMVFQDNNLFPHLTVSQNVGLGRDPSLNLSEADKSSVATVLDRVGLTGLGDRKPHALSGGQQSRVALARALVRERPLLLLDEPFAALGPAQRLEMLDLVSETASEANRTVLIVTHHPEDARHFADETVFVSEGLAQAPVPTGQLLDDPPQALADYIGRK